jgi:hypothetical protein
LDLQEVSTVALNAAGDGLVIRIWRPRRAVEELRRT